MSYIAAEDVAKAKEMDLLTYLRNYEPQELVHVSGNTYCTREHDSLRISNGKWCWFSQGIGGRSALDYLIKVKGISNDIGNKHSPTVIIAAITSRVRKKKKLPTHLYLGQIEGLPANSIILFEQLRTIDKSRLKEHLTHLDEKYLKSLEFPLLISIGVEKRRSL